MHLLVCHLSSRLCFLHARIILLKLAVTDVGPVAEGFASWVAEMRAPIINTFEDDVIRITLQPMINTFEDHVTLGFHRESR